MSTIRRVSYMLLACAGFLLLGGCQQATQPDARTQQAAQQDISDLHSQFLKAFNSKSPEGLGAVYTNDGVLMPPNFPEVKTQLAIQEYYRAMLASSPVNGMLLNVSETVISGDYAFCSGYYTLLDKGGNNIDHGKFLEVLKLEGRDWKFYRDIYNSDMAPPAPTPAAATAPTPAPSAKTH